METIELSDEQWDALQFNMKEKLDTKIIPTVAYDRVYIKKNKYYISIEDSEGYFRFTIREVYDQLELSFFMYDDITGVHTKIIETNYEGTFEDLISVERCTTEVL